MIFILLYLSALSLSVRGVARVALHLWDMFNAISWSRLRDIQLRTAYHSSTVSFSFQMHALFLASKQALHQLLQR